MRFLTLHVSALFLLTAATADVAPAQMTRVARITATEWGSAAVASVSIEDDRAVLGTYDTGLVHVLERGTSGEWAKVAELTPDQGVGVYGFGISVDQDGDRILVGSPSEGNRAGAAYVFERDGAGTWIQVARLATSTPFSGSDFGGSVSIEGDAVLVLMSRYAAVYVFERTGPDTWTEMNAFASVQPPSAGSAPDEHSRVAISGDRAIVGYPSDPGVSGGAGIAVVFRRNESGLWSEEGRLEPGDETPSPDFGYSVAIQGTRAIVGATDKEAAYIFERDGTGLWGEVARLVSGEPMLGGLFGSSVSLSGDRAIVGEPNSIPGTAYVFERDGAGNWIEAERLRPENVTEYTNFGYDVSLSGNRAIVVAPTEQTGGVAEFGAIYIFEALGVGVDDWEKPGEFSLSPNYPNPFNPTTTIQYALPTSSAVTLTVFDMLGRRVRAVEEGPVAAGYHRVVFDASNLPSGIYLYRLSAGDYVETRSMVVVR